MDRVTPTFRCLTTPLLIMGAERIPAVVTVGCVLLCAICAAFLRSFVAAGLALFLWTSGMAFFRAMAKRDPQMVEKGIRFFRYQRFYPARTKARG
jgi:type IV secretory pathway TrbD component